jgi:REP element-mobilizing transposase RayT
VCNNPIAYFITFTTHGTWLHGDLRQSVIRDHGISKLLAPNDSMYRQKRDKLKHPPVELYQKQREIVLDTVTSHCVLKQWRLFAAHVRSNHVHTIIQSGHPINDVMMGLKIWATRKLSEGGYCYPKVWTVGGSKRYIFSDDKLREKIHYVIYEQGAMMQYYIDPSFHSLPN